MARRQIRTVIALSCGGPGKRELRAQVEDTNGTRCVDLRVWLRKRSGVMPSTHGLRLDVSDLPILQSAVLALSQATGVPSFHEAA